MKSDQIIEKICESIEKESGNAFTDEGSKSMEEVKNLEERIKNTIDTKINELNKKLDSFIENTKAPASAGADVTKPQSEADAHTETLKAEKAEGDHHE